MSLKSKQILGFDYVLILFICSIKAKLYNKTKNLLLLKKVADISSLKDEKE
jgi:hypothetical protein